MNIKKKFFKFTFLMLAFFTVVEASAIESFQTPYTISKVRSATMKGKKVVIASSFEGVVLCMDYQGKIMWENPLSGYYNHDIYPFDIDGDGKDEVLAANADGTLFLLDDNGKVLWKFSRNPLPLYSVCVININNKPIIACGGLDKNIYFLDSKKNLLQTIPSLSYSVTKAWADQKDKPAQNSINFLRPIKDSDGRELLCVHGTVSSNNTNGALYIMDIDLNSSKPKVLKKYTKLGGDPLGSFSTHSEKGKRDRVLMGGSAMVNGATVVDVNSETDKIRLFEPQTMRGKNSKGQTLLDMFGYRVTQIETIPDKSLGYKYFVLLGSRVILLSPDMKWNKDKDVIINQYSFNDMCKDRDNVIILGSAQSGGNCIHFIDTSNDKWKVEMPKLVPEGNIASILASTAQIRKQMESYKRPKEQNIQPVYFLSDGIKGSVVSKYVGKYKSPIFLASTWAPKVESAQSMRRDTMSSDKYRTHRDKRRKYELTSQQVIDGFTPLYKGAEGASFWGGHGNDPYFYSAKTLINLMKTKEAKGKTTVLLYPELQDASDEFKYVMNTLLSPLAEFSKEAKESDGTNLKLFIRTKNTFWHSAVYREAWEKLISGQYSDVFIPALEETSSRTMEMSVAARLGIWASGSVDSWGSRCARDNPSHDRLRQHSHQMLPNHFLRNMVYHISLGAQYLDNFAVDQNYMSTLWDLIGTGMLYVPKRDELVSLSPVTLAMREPDSDFLTEGVLGKWTILYDEKESKNHIPMVFDRMNVTWTAGVVAPWDYSRYAAGVKDRRSHFLPSFANGLVMLSPAIKSSPYRKEMENYLHPLYNGKIKRYETDGKYYWVDGQKKDADTYYKVVADDIKASAEILPLTVTGEVAWVTAQTAPKHLRLTIIDGGYLNPSEKEVTINIKAAKVKSITDLATGKAVKVKGDKAQITIPCGLFKFLDVELQEPLVK